MKLCATLLALCTCLVLQASAPQKPYPLIVVIHGDVAKGDAYGAYFVKEHKGYTSTTKFRAGLYTDNLTTSEFITLQAAIQCALKVAPDRNRTSSWKESANGSLRRITTDLSY